MNTSPHAHTLARRWTLGAAAVLTVVALISAGGGAAASAAVAAVIVVLFLSSGLVALRLFGREDVPGQIGLVVFLLALALRLALVLFVVALIVRFDWVDREWLGISIVVCALVWIIAHTAHAWRQARSELIVEPESTDDGGAR